MTTMTDPNWSVKTTKTIPNKPFKVYPKGNPGWDNENPENFFAYASEADAEAKQRNHSFAMFDYSKVEVEEEVK